MENPIFRKKSIERVSSPEQLNDYIKVTNPGVWIILAAVFLLIAGFIVWGVVGKVETKINAVAVSEVGVVYCYVRESQISGIEEGDEVRIGENDYKITDVPTAPIIADESVIKPYVMRVGGISQGEGVYKITLSGELSEGVYKASIVTAAVSPISFLFN